MIRPEELSDLATLAGLAEELVHQHLSSATDVDGQARVVVVPSASEQLHCLVREVARRCRRLEKEAAR